MKFARALLFAFAAAAIPASATVLTFDITALVDGSLVPQDYGDRVVSTTAGAFSYGAAGGFTPNVLADYVGSGNQLDLNFWTTGYSNLTNIVEYEPDGDPGFRIRLTADAGAQARLDGFDLGNFGGQITLPSLRVEDGQGNILFSRLAFTLEANTVAAQHYDFPGGLSASQLNIIVDATGLGGNSDNIGLDNIQFGQAIPEPSACLFGAMGLIGLGIRRGRNGRNG